MDKRFEQVDERFEAMQWFMGTSFDLVIGILDLLKLM